jgi:hypothetical protein
VDNGPGAGYSPRLLRGPEALEDERPLRGRQPAAGIGRGWGGGRLAQAADHSGGDAVQEAAIGRRQSEWADRPRVDPIIGLRRALGAHRGQIRIRFLAESIALAVLGGSAGALLVGVVAGVYPAMRAARLAPTEALAAP